MESLHPFAFGRVLRFLDSISWKYGEVDLQAEIPILLNNSSTSLHPSTNIAKRHFWIGSHECISTPWKSTRLDIYSLQSVASPITSPPCQKFSHFDDRPHLLLDCFDLNYYKCGCRRFSLSHDFSATIKTSFLGAASLQKNLKLAWGKLEWIFSRSQMQNLLVSPFEKIVEWSLRILFAVFRFWRQAITGFIKGREKGITSPSFVIAKSNSKVVTLNPSAWFMAGTYFRH